MVMEQAIVTSFWPSMGQDGWILTKRWTTCLWTEINAKKGQGYNSAIFTKQTWSISQSDNSFSYVCPVIDPELCHNIVKVPMGAQYLDNERYAKFTFSNSTAHEKLTYFFFLQY